MPPRVFIASHAKKEYTEKKVVPPARSVNPCQPYRGRVSGITLGAPDAEDSTEAQFEFRILKGHTAANLLKHRDASTAIFVGLAFMARRRTAQ